MRIQLPYSTDKIQKQPTQSRFKMKLRILVFPQDFNRFFAAKPLHIQKQTIFAILPGYLDDRFDRPFLVSLFIFLSA
jgi:hypothetical protein